MTDDEVRRLDALLQVALRLARSAPTGSLALARVADAIDPRWIPRPWGDPIVAELEAARAEAGEPIPMDRVERVLADAWGVKPTEELDELDAEPVAVTPIAQVHRGRLEDEDVAVKVLRPGIASSIRQDLALLEGLAPALTAAFPAIDPAALLAEVRERTLDELDLEHEAMAQRRFYRALRNHPQLSVPKPITRLAHETVLVSEWVDGVPLVEAPDRDRAASLLVIFALGAARSGVVHADLHPNDVLVRDDGGLAILDFGATSEADRDRVQAAATAFEALIDDDLDGLGTELERLGWLSADHAPAAHALARDGLGDLIGDAPVRLDVDAVIAARDRILDRPDALIEVLRAGRLAPEDLWPARGLGALFGTIARVGATASWVQVARAALREGWDATVPEPAA